MMYAVSIGSNFQQQTAFAEARIALGALGACQFSDCFELPDRDGSTDVFWNMAVLIDSVCVSVEQFTQQLLQIEQACGRVRPSRYVRLDLDLIAYGQDHHSLMILSNRLPLTVDVQMPLQTLWPQCGAALQRLVHGSASE